MCPGAPDEEARRRDYFALAVNRSGNCSTIAAASGSAIICMWPAAARMAVYAPAWSFAAWVSTTLLSVMT